MDDLVCSESVGTMADVDARKASWKHASSRVGVGLWAKYSALALLCASTVAAANNPRMSAESNIPHRLAEEVQHPFGLEQEHVIPEPSHTSLADKISAAEDESLFKPFLKRKPYLPSPETVYFNRWFPRLRAENPDLSNEDIGERIGQAWLHAKAEDRRVHEFVSLDIHRQWSKSEVESRHWGEKGKVVAPRVCTEPGSYEEELYPPVLPAPAKSQLWRDVLCELIGKEERTTRKRVQELTDERWASMTAEQREYYHEKEQLHEAPYISKWREFADITIRRHTKVPAWILPCNDSSTSTTGLAQSQLKETILDVGVSVENPPEPQRGRRSPYMIYYMREICKLAIEHPDTSIGSLGQQIDLAFPSLPASDLAALDSEHQEYKKEFLAQWAAYWTQITAYLADPQHIFEQKNLWLLKIARPDGAMPLFVWDTEYKWLVEKRLPWIKPAMMQMAEQAWNVLPDEMRKVYEDWDRDLKRVYKEVMGEEWGNVMKAFREAREE